MADTVQLNSIHKIFCISLVFVFTLSTEVEAAFSCGDTLTTASDKSDVVFQVLNDNSEIPELYNSQVFLPAISGPDQQFGYSVSLDADTLVIGQWSDPVEQSGLVSIYRNQSGVWNLIKTFTSPESQPEDGFASVSVDGDTLLVGAFRYDGCGNDCSSGAAYIFERNKGGIENWGFVKRLDDGTKNDNWFGYNTALDGDIALVHERGGREDTPNSAVLVYERDRGGKDNWGLVKRLESDNVPKLEKEWFGPLLAIDGNEIFVIGDSTSTVFIFDRDYGGQDNWGLKQKITGPCRKGDIATDGEILILNIYDADLPSSERISALIFYQKDDNGVWTKYFEIEEDFKIRRLAIDGNHLVASRSDLNEIAYLYQRESQENSWAITKQLVSKDDYLMKYSKVDLESGRAVVTSYSDDGEGLVLSYAIAEPINAGHAGAWYNPDTSGQGQLIDIESEKQFMFLAWFTYTDADSDNPGEQRWLTAQGNYTGNKAELPVYETLGGEFDDPQAVTSEQVGEAIVSLTNCRLGHMKYRLYNEDLSGAFPMVRAISGSGGVCEEQAGSATEMVDINPGMDGAWFDAGAPGQGFLIDAHTNPDGSNFIFVAWFTYGDDSASGQRWLTAQGDFAGSTAELLVYESTGGNFDDPAVPETIPAGTMNIDFNDCTNAVLTYSLTEDGAEGSMDITRAIPGSQALCEEFNGQQ